MNGIVNIASTGVASPAIPSVCVSRGVLSAMQGTGLSAVRVFGIDAKAPKHAVLMDKTQWDWRQAFTNAVIAEAIFHAAHADRTPAYLPGARLRNANPATVFRSRHRLR
ncbi:hypothetical protein IU500_17335 [Nocardia terpenica]|uniref:hypothetical protein n=1 Tax=Nocardia terpenica TaxID=455432 RepID=UPI0018937991|nr:hypothetical protein [Nocardia terpenica]MBF6063250.1 hypothetical protein [Nocardia terpenica]MBF6105806.1 hypothetical protein [Nocardia terpenica]MBF6113610.1 hypothetical protein [Nocardia terpenica]MBF6119547.1 hypothetical protein [Nocardia terpenica]MBF6151958.1 hypothetical protein [Nocardia terpenica]